jgi:hypothetical protein
MKKLILIPLCLILAICAYGQVMADDNSSSAKAYQKEYNKNIKLTKINGVYIPASLEEAFSRLERLSPPASIAKFQSGEESIVAKKLHYGIGRWMINNWNFFGGSRFSHMLKIKGVVHPDDMAQFVIRTFHRHLNNKPLDEESLIQELAVARKKTAQEVLGFQTKDNH